MNRGTSKEFESERYPLNYTYEVLILLQRCVWVVHEEHWGTYILSTRNYISKIQVA